MSDSIDKKEFAQLTGLEKVVILLLSLKESNVTKILSMLDDFEIKEISRMMSITGSVPANLIEAVVDEFRNKLSDSAAFVGNLETTERILMSIMGEDKVESIMEEIRGPAGKSTWDKLGNINEELFANYIKNEYPQTAALVMSKIVPKQAAKILNCLPDDFAFDVMIRMLTIESVKKEVLDSVETTLRQEFISTLTRSQKLDSHQQMAELFNNLDRNSESKYMGVLEEKLPESAEKIKKLMFTFEDLVRLDNANIQILLQAVNKSLLPMALKGATQAIKDLFLNNMASRASKAVIEEMEAMGPVKLKDVDAAQSEIVTVCKELSGRGDIVINESKSEGEEEMVY